MVLLSGIDTSKNKSVSCIVIGIDAEINKLYKKIDSLLAKNGEKHPELHWNKLRKKTRSKIYKDAVKILLNSKRVRIIIFKHKKPRTFTKKEYFLQIVPNAYAEELEKNLKWKKFDVKIEVDDDFTLKNVQNSSRRFLEKTIENLSYRLTGKITKVLVFVRSCKSTIRPRDESITIHGVVKDSRDSKAIQLSDLVLGLYNEFPRSLSKLKKIEV